jgi:hypothetical protein
MDLRRISRWLALGRVSLGAAALLAPGPLARVWIGQDSARPGARTLARGMGARDLAIGAGTLIALRRRGAVRGWLEAGAVADAGDLAATLLSFRDLPAGWRVLVSLAAGTSAAVALAAVRSLSSSGR